MTDHCHRALPRSHGVPQPGSNTRNVRRGPASAVRLRGLVAALALSACSDPSSPSPGLASPADQALCTSAPDAGPDPHWVSSWRTAPGDALITHPITGLTVRQSFAPHRDGARLRLRLSNRYSA